MAAVAPNPRDSAVAFTEGVRGGWIASDLRAWIEEHLVQCGRLAVRNPVAVRIVQTGLGSIDLPRASGAGSRMSAEAGVHVVGLVTAARERVLQTLRASIDTGQSAYIHAALYAGRVSRERGADGKSSWLVFLSEDVPMSDQVLSLFAADALTRPDQYDADLCVCDVCGAVSFTAGEPSRHGCARHPFGAMEGGRPSPPPAARRAVQRT